jgi:hypothetical protein
MRGTTKNIGEGGMAGAISSILHPGAVLYCRIHIPGTQISVPTLVQVRWSSSVRNEDGYAVGLKFLL